MSADIGAVSAMVVNIDVAASRSEGGCEAFVSRRMFGKAVAYLDDRSRRVGTDGAERKFRFVWDLQMMNGFEGHSAI